MRNPWPDIAANGCTLYIFHFVKERVRGQTHRELSTADPAGPHCLNLETRTLTHTPGGAGRDRTDDPRLAKPMLSQLSYSPLPCLPPPAPQHRPIRGGSGWVRTNDPRLIKTVL
jgi:hypothetical protein